MTVHLQQAFAAFVHDSCEDLVVQLATAVQTPLMVLDSRGDVVLHTPGAPDPARRFADGAGPGFSAAIAADADAFGSLVAISSSQELEPLILSVATEIGRRFSLECDIDRMTSELLSAYDQLNLFYDFSRSLRPDESLNLNARRLITDTASFLDRRFIALYLPDLADMTWSNGPGLFSSPELKWLTDGGTALQKIQDELQRLLGEGKLSDDSRHSGKLRSPHGEIDYLVIPVWVKWDFRGYIGLFKAAADQPFETGEIRIVETLAEELANAATNQELNLELRQLLFNMVKSLVAAIEAKDNYTLGHSERLVKYCTLMAERIGLAKEEIQVLSWAAILHDIGKIAIEDGILNKPGKLSQQEFEIVKAHPTIGAGMLEPISQLRNVLPGIRHHHERFDGGGYPDGLQGEGIPLFGRIIAVADAFDAMVTARSYRQAQSMEYALGTIRDGAGTQFDPQITRLFLELVQDGNIEHPNLGEAASVHR